MANKRHLKADKANIQNKQNYPDKVNKANNAFRGDLSPFRLLMIEISKAWRNEPNSVFINVKFIWVQFATWIKIAIFVIRIIKAVLRLNKAS